eukprot:CAMPEP_0115351838 /NCGR_PEP_ID=MMETSP0270-20121206/97196_1 /TAXON_ID=71861 /ORGANISM="Scrippsiella trochoidea, Strain CCMP3099" /LENGTH=51 /DNA_ID=CAMNT_0002773991 /DNA_START=527 /DNA_END=682 /DNA_ORIENTATION=-
MADNGRLGHMPGLVPTSSESFEHSTCSPFILVIRSSSSMLIPAVKKCAEGS